MQKLKLAYAFFFIAAMVFLAKPFVGFYMHNAHGQKVTKYSLAVKVFSIRKPEFFDEAKKKKTEIAAQTNPPLRILASIIALLSTLFLIAPIRRYFYIPKARYSMGNIIYLLTGKLTI